MAMNNSLDDINIDSDNNDDLGLLGDKTSFGMR